MQDILFTPVTINRLSVKNRIYLPAMHLNMCKDYAVTDQLIEFYKARARGGAGMINVGYATVNDLAGNAMAIGGHEDAYLPGLSALAAAIKENGALASIQINHAGRYNHSFFIGGKQPVAPSPIASRLTRETPRELEAAEITQIIADFAETAARMKKAGFDCVDVLSATGYLISEFLSPLTNQRTDEWGGSFENRQRFGLSIARAIREAVGPDFALTFRINGNEFMPGGLGRRELMEYAKNLDSAGVDAICVNVGWHEARVPQIVTGVPRGVFAYLSRGIKESVGVPVIASHRINDPKVARELITDGMCDMAAMGRALIADPDLPDKTAQGRENELIHCVACAQGCFDHLFQLKHVACLCNPVAGYEAERAIVPAEAKKKVLIAGAGAAGLAAAFAAAQRGHEVIVCEKDDHAGGQLLLAGAPPGREEFRVLAEDLLIQARKAGAQIRFSCPVDAALLNEIKPDHVIVATGATPVAPKLPGADLPHVVQAWDVLAKRAFTGRRVLILGGGAVGIETALFLAERGTLSGEDLKFLLVNRAESPEDLYELATIGTKDVTVLEMEKAAGKDFGKTTRWTMMADVARSRIKVLTETKAVAITEKGVLAASAEGETEIPADSVVLAVGARPEQALAGLCEQKGIPCSVAGDASAIGRAFEAIHQGFLEAAKI